MDIVIPYNSPEERERIIKEYANLYLIEERNLIDGNYLVFAQAVPASPIDTEKMLQELSDRQKLMQQALDDLIMGGF